MPNWCHNTLTINLPIGTPEETEELSRFVDQAPPSKEYLTRLHRESPPFEKLPALEQYIEETRAEQPLSFASFAPEPDNAVYEQMEEDSRTECRLCGGKGKRPVTQAEADEWGIPFYEGIMPELPFEERRPCNGCDGKGQAVGFGAGWHEWRIEHWGTKWDASFSGPMGAICAPEADVDLSVEAEGATHTKEVVVYKFDTAWSPPVPAVQAMSNAFPHLTFTLRFGEPGNGFAGEVVYEAGFCIEETELEVEAVLAAEEMWF